MTRRASSSWWADDELEFQGDPSLVLELDHSTGSRRTGGLHERSDAMDRLARLEARVEELARAFGVPPSDRVKAAAVVAAGTLELDGRIARIEAALEATAPAEELTDLVNLSGERWRRLDRAIARLVELHDCDLIGDEPENCPICALNLEYNPPEPEPEPPHGG